MRISIPLILPFLLHLAALVIGLVIILRTTDPEGTSTGVSLSSLDDAYFRYITFNTVSTVTVDDVSVSTTQETARWYWDRTCKNGLLGANCVRFQDLEPTDGEKGMVWIESHVFKYSVFWLLPLMTALNGALAIALLLLICGVARKVSNLFLSDGSICIPQGLMRLSDHVSPCGRYLAHSSPS